MRTTGSTQPPTHLQPRVDHRRALNQLITDRHRVRLGESADGDGGDDGVGGRVDHRHRAAAFVGDEDVGAGGVDRYRLRLGVGADADGGGDGAGGVDHRHVAAATVGDEDVAGIGAGGADSHADRAGADWDGVGYGGAGGGDHWHL